MNATAPLSDLCANTTPSSAIPPSSAPSSGEPAVQAMHQGNLEMQRQLLQQKLAERETGSFISPTDEMMTPCSKKLQNHKQKAYSKAKPLSLASRFGKPEGGKENKKGGLFGTAASTPRSSSSLADPFAGAA